MVGTLATICDVVAQADIKPPALVIVGEVVKLRSTIDWFEKRPLFGRRIVVTRTREQASDLVAQLEEHGAECLEYSTIHIEPVDDYRIIDRAIAEIADYQWLLFTSLNAVSYFFQRLAHLEYDSRHLAGTKIAVVGKATAEELRKYGVKADLLPEKFTGEGLGRVPAPNRGQGQPHSPAPRPAGQRDSAGNADRRRSLGHHRPGLPQHPAPRASRKSCVISCSREPSTWSPLPVLPR